MNKLFLGDVVEIGVLSFGVAFAAGCFAGLGDEVFPVLRFCGMRRRSAMAGFALNSGEFGCQFQIHESSRLIKAGDVAFLASGQFFLRFLLQGFKGF